MKRSLSLLLLSLVIICTLFSDSVQAEKKTIPGKNKSAQTASKIPAPLTWPRFLEHEKGTLKVYQPQIEKWKKGTMKYRMAIEIILKADPKPVYGALWLKANTDTDLDERLVRIKDIKVLNISIQE